MLGTGEDTADGAPRRVLGTQGAIAQVGEKRSLLLRVFSARV